MSNNSYNQNQSRLFMFRTPAKPLNKEEVFQPKNISTLASKKNLTSAFVAHNDTTNVEKIIHTNFNQNCECLSLNEF